MERDTEKAFKMLNSRGIILWHDYVPEKKSSKDVVRYIDEISKVKDIQNINEDLISVSEELESLNEQLTFENNLLNFLPSAFFDVL